ncbi:MAG: hypothetical protein V1779_07145 [bacterium]
MKTENFLQKFLPVFVAAFLVDFLIKTIIGLIRWGTLDFYWESSLTLAVTIASVYTIFELRKKK